MIWKIICANTRGRLPLGPSQKKVSARALPARLSLEAGPLGSSSFPVSNRAPTTTSTWSFSYQTNSLLDKTQNEISSGKKINSPKDDAATLAIAQNLLGEISGAGAVKTALSFGEASVSVAAAASEAVGELLVEAKGVAVAASQEGLDADSRQALQAEFNALRDQISSVVGSAEFNGNNLVEAGASDLEVLSDESGNTITVAAGDLSTAGLGIDTSTLGTAADAGNAVAALDAALASASSSAASFGTAANNIENQSEFTTELTNSLRQGVGNLVDADLSDTRAQQISQQVKQKLGVQALSIANSAPQALVSLFQ